ncbi:MAG: hypothetical protein OHK0012_04810 [Synechococcales cyanobacterium]
MQPIMTGKNHNGMHRVNLWPRVILSVSLGWFLAGCGGGDPIVESSPSPNGADSTTATPDPLSYENITLTQSGRTGQLQWKITASLARYTPEQTAAALTSVTGEFYDAQGEPIRVTAASGDVQVQERRLTLTGAIQAEYPSQGLTLKAQQVEWIPDNNRITASERIVVRFQDPEQSGRQSQLEGSRLLWDTDNRVLTLERQGEPVRLTSTAPELTLTATEMIWNLPGQTLQAVGAVNLSGKPTPGDPEVNLRAATLTLTPNQATLSGDAYGRTARGDELWAQLIRWPLQGTTLYASGGVRYRQAGANLSLNGREAVVNWQTQTARLSGGTTTIQGF